MAARNWLRANVEIFRSLTATTPYFLRNVMRIHTFEGRRGGLAQPQLGSAQVTVDAPGGSVLTTQPESISDAKQLVGRPVNIRLYEQGSGLWRGRIFRGIITKTAVQRSEQTYRVLLTLTSRGYSYNRDITLPSGTPAEALPARISRIRGLAGASDEIALSPAFSSYQAVALDRDREGSAIFFLRQCADTAAAVWWGNLYMDAAADQSAGILWLTDDPASERGFELKIEPRVEVDSRLLVTSTDFTDGAGERHTARNQSAVDQYGLSRLRVTTVSSAEATEELASYWRGRYSEPISAVLECQFRPNDDLAGGAQWPRFIDDDATAEAVRPGFTAQLTHEREGRRFQVSNRIEGIEWEFLPWDPETGRPLIFARVWLLPLVFLATTRWVLGSSQLGDATGFTSDPASADPNFRWPMGGGVSAAGFNRFNIGQSYIYHNGDSLPRPQNNRLLIQRTSAGAFRMHVGTSGRWLLVARSD